MEKDLINLNDDGNARFKIECLRCKSTNVIFYDWRGCSDETGSFGELQLLCRDCKASRVLLSEHGSLLTTKSPHNELDVSGGGK